MTPERLRKLKPKRSSFEWSKEKLEPIEFYSIFTDEYIKKMIKSEEIAEAYLNGELRKGNLDDFFDMRFPKELTDYNTKLMNALEGRYFNEHPKNYEAFRKRFKKENPEKRYEAERLCEKTRSGDESLLIQLKELVQGNEEAIKIIDEIIFRFKELDGYMFKRYLGWLLGTKFDWMGVKDGWVTLYDAKSSYIIDSSLAEYYLRFTKAKIPFFLLIWDEGSGELRGFEMKRFDPKKMINRYGDYTIPKEETVCLKIIPREASEPS